MGALSGCDGASSNQFDNVTGTLCIYEQRLSEIEKRLKIKVPDEQKMKCNVQVPQPVTYMEMRVK